MRLFRNRSFAWEFAVTASVLFIVAFIQLFIAPVSALVTVIGGGLVLYAIFCTGKKRYRDMEHLSEELDKILHGTENFFISECKEGELAILNSNIRKMTIKMKEQASQLTHEKILLTDAIADIFHQLRTPLTSMRLTCSMLSEEELSYEDRVRFVRGIKKQLERMQWLVETLLKMSKIEAGTVTFRKDEIKVNDIMEKACEPLLIPLELRGVTLKKDLGDAGLTGDPEWLAEAFGNIVKNCMEHTPEGGSITIDAEENALYTRISISDTGTGFEKEDLPHIFERFYKGKNSSSESVGIGLALCRTIITGLGGTIKAENGKEGGARFEVRFYKSVV
ncbi:MAG: HAMP domain-containing histidine kinase [Lachnospiraceae bacterium]|nr:HAMP domain-containing histidine kinase [Lachnospiraceae bacterium]MBR4780554.1 HAMP domain-containing histidine kinase [Lachnospiraceae bacterium]